MTASKLKWKGKFHNVETTHFQKVWIDRGLLLGHDKEEMVLMVDTCLGYTAVFGAKLFSEQE